jgi:hypothetical protein
MLGYIYVYINIIEVLRKHTKKYPVCKTRENRIQYEYSICHIQNGQTQTQNEKHDKYVDKTCGEKRKINPIHLFTIIHIRHR